MDPLSGPFILRKGSSPAGITWVLTHGRAARGNPTTAYINTSVRYTVLEILIVGLDTNITKNHLNMFPEILNFFLNISKSSKHIKTIWLHFINSTVKTPKIACHLK